MKYIKFITVILLTLFFITVNAAECDQKELKQLQADAKKLEFVYEPYESEEDGLRFKITIYNLNKDIVALVERDIYSLDFDEFKKNSDGSYYRDGYQEGETVKITVRSYTRDACSFEKLLTKNIKLPYHNIYYNSEDCKENPDFKYCQNEYVSSHVKDVAFQRELEAYKKANQVEEPKEESNSLMFIIIAVVAVIVIVIVTLIIVKVIKKKKENDI